jgi:hypothetical protein
MKPSHTQTPRTLGECTFTEIHAYSASLPNNSGAWWVAGLLALAVLIGWSLA